MNNTKIKAMIGICSAVAVLAIGGGVAALTMSNRYTIDSDRFVTESTITSNQDDYTGKKNDSTTSESAGTSSNDSSSIKVDELVNSNAEQETSQTGSTTSESDNSYVTDESGSTGTESVESQPADTQPVTTQPPVTSTVTTNTPNNNTATVWDSEADQKLAIGEINSQGYKVIGITSDGVRYIATDEKWETKAWAIIGYDNNGKPQYTMDNAKANEIHKEAIEAGIKWIEENNVYIGN